MAHIVGQLPNLKLSAVVRETVFGVSISSWHCSPK